MAPASPGLLTATLRVTRDASAVNPTSAEGRPWEASSAQTPVRLVTEMDGAPLWSQLLRVGLVAPDPRTPPNQSQDSAARADPGLQQGFNLGNVA